MLALWLVTIFFQSSLYFNDKEIIVYRIVDAIFVDLKYLDLTSFKYQNFFFFFTLITVVEKLCI